MPRKSTGGVSVGGGSQPSTPKSRKSISTDSPLPLNPDVSITTTSANASLSIPTTSKAVLKQQEVALRGIESFELPRGPLIKFAKTTLPDSITLRKDTQSAIVRSASVFISYLTSTAHDNAKAKKGKIIGAQHVIDALRDLDFTHEEVKEIKDHLRAYREAAAKKKEKSKESKDGATGEGEKDGDQSLVEDALEVEEEYEEEAAEQEEDDEGADQLMDED
ncbi:potential histone-like transcription factor [Pseudozyma hubeiensis SY62]|uniref:DNA polymerase epsilon subunit D n=1 Tax=Pseudozyma hubeiensis (strain SY62) TaxID=1305764 RepID=R9PCH2_PSEHS|nr:potential histone-like transcription factor [Pseudozyma hubeiensis SY62]GAC99059.1 potential histone-like transcription factor [Pseudozyma hubeiensis SY62]